MNSTYQQYLIRRGKDTMAYTDAFSKQADVYSKFRFQYPKVLYNFLYDNLKSFKSAWDVGTRNGQAALALAEKFEQVTASDLSERQIASAFKKHNIEYIASPAEEMQFPEDSLDLIVVAQAVHWFNLDIFWDKVRKSLKHNGLIACWGYSFNEPICPKIDQILNTFYFQTLGPYWSPNNKILWDKYQNIPFPFSKISAPEIFIEEIMDLDDLMNLLLTMSSTVRYIEKHHVDPTTQLKEDLKILWPGKIPLKWKIHILGGKNS